MVMDGVTKEQVIKDVQEVQLCLEQIRVIRNRYPIGTSIRHTLNTLCDRIDVFSSLLSQHAKGDVI